MVKIPVLIFLPQKAGGGVMDDHGGGPCKRTSILKFTGSGFVFLALLSFIAKYFDESRKVVLAMGKWINRWPSIICVAIIMIFITIMFCYHEKMKTQRVMLRKEQDFGKSSLSEGKAESKQAEFSKNREPTRMQSKGKVRGKCGYVPMEKNKKKKGEKRICERCFLKKMIRKR